MYFFEEQRQNTLDKTHHQTKHTAMSHYHHHHHNEDIGKLIADGLFGIMYAFYYVGSKIKHIIKPSKPKPRPNLNRPDGTPDPDAIIAALQSRS